MTYGISTSVEYALFNNADGPLRDMLEKLSVAMTEGILEIGEGEGGGGGKESTGLSFLEQKTSDLLFAALTVSDPSHD